MATNNQQDALMIPDARPSFLPAVPDNLAELYAGELSHDAKITLPKVKVPAGGGLTWELAEGIADDPRRFAAIVVYHHRANALWLQDYDGSIKQPDCSSPNGINAYGQRGTLPNGASEIAPAPHGCDSCPWTQYGTAKNGRGMRCKQSLFLYLIFPQKPDALPHVMILPPTCLAVWNNFLQQELLPERARVRDRVIEFGLSKVTKPPAPVYSVIAPKLGRWVTEQEFQAIAEAREGIVAMHEKQVAKVMSGAASDFGDVWVDDNGSADRAA